MKYIKYKSWDGEVEYATVLGWTWAFNETRDFSKLYLIRVKNGPSFYREFREIDNLMEVSEEEYLASLILES